MNHSPTPPTLPKQRRFIHRGFTLVELVAATAIMAILMTGMGSAIIIASTAIPDGNSPAEIATDSRNVLDRMTEDLLFAKALTEMTSTAVTMKVANRGHGADGPETIRYAWSGTLGDPMTLEYNGAKAVILVEDVHAFALSYEVKSVPADEVPLVEGSERSLLVQDISNSGYATQLSEMAGALRHSEYFHPFLSPEATSWRITRASFVANPKKPASSTFSVSVQAGDLDGVPDGTVVDEVTVQESSLVADNWHVVTFANAGGLDPASGACIVFQAAGSSTAGLLTLATASSTTPNTKYHFFNGAWSGVADTDIWLWVWGRETAPGSGGASPAGSRLSSVRIELQVGNQASTHVQTEVIVLNEIDGGGP